MPDILSMRAVWSADGLNNRPGITASDAIFSDSYKGGIHDPQDLPDAALRSRDLDYY